MPHTVALTGATGFVGGAIARRLVADGWHVRALVRARSNTERLPRLDALERVPGSLEDCDSLRRLVSGADAIVHCAGAVRGRSEQDFVRVNVDGVARLIDAARERARDSRFLLMSSLASREPQLSHYASSKRRGEQVLESRAGPMRWIALRPPAVYGPGDRELLPLFRAMDRGFAPVLGSPEARFSLIYVDDLAAAVAAWLASDKPPQGLFELHDGRLGGYRWKDVIEVAARRRGRPVRAVPVPRAVLLGVAWIGGLAARALGRAPMLTPGKVRELTHPDWVCDDSAFTTATGWVPQVRFDQGLELTLAASRDGG
ncbi:MAG: NAD-dependent epimerase/dehydratase family protein [Chromatiales bacterium]